MNKKLVALAVAAAVCAPVAALADTGGITLTGVINGSFEASKISGEARDAKNQTGIGTNATRWQLDGSEELGGGTKAIFSLAVDQSFANTDSNGNTVFNRNSYIGLAGAWGALKWGQNEHEYEIQQIKQDPFPASENRGNALNLMTRWGTDLSQPGFTRRDPQSIWYQTPDLGGFLGTIAYITGSESKSNNRDPKGFQLAGQYNIGTLALYAAYADYKDDNLAGLGLADKNKAFRLGAGYGFGNFQIDVAGEQLKADLNGGGDAKRNNYYVSANYRMGPGALKASFAAGQKLKGSVCNAGGAFGGGACDDTKATLWTIGYWYDLSKRTSVYIDYYSLDNKRFAAYTAGAPHTNAGETGLGVDEKGVSIGMRHSF
jgi:predicted porin